MIQGLKLKLVLSTESPFLGKVASHKFGRLAPTYTALQKREQHWTTFGGPRLDYMGLRIQGTTNIFIEVLKKTNKSISTNGPDSKKAAANPYLRRDPRMGANRDVNRFWPYAQAKVAWHARFKSQNTTDIHLQFRFFKLWSALPSANVIQVSPPYNLPSFAAFSKVNQRSPSSRIKRDIEGTWPQPQLCVWSIVSTISPTWLGGRGKDTYTDHYMQFYMYAYVYSFWKATGCLSCCLLELSSLYIYIYICPSLYEYTSISDEFCVDVYTFTAPTAKGEVKTFSYHTVIHVQRMW